MRAQQAFLKKVELLEAWADHGGAPEGYSWPKGPAELRRWTDDALGLRAWSSPNITTDYRELRHRFDAAIARLGAQQRPTGSQNIAKDNRAKVARLKLQLSALREQVVTLQQDLVEVSHKLELEKDAHRSLRARAEGRL